MNIAEQNSESNGATSNTTISKLLFEPDVRTLGDNPERAPLVYVFERALARQRASLVRRSLLAKLASTLSLVDRRLVPESMRSYAAECGVFRGLSLRACLKISSDFSFPLTFYGLDTFSGLPDLSATDLEIAAEDAPYRHKKLFTHTSIEKVLHIVGRPSWRHNVVLMPGLFADTLPQLPERRYFFVNIDCDLYDGHTECLEYFYPRMISGGTVFFDDYNSVDYPMARRAIDDFLRDKPEPLWQIRMGKEGDNLTKAFIVKY